MITLTINSQEIASEKEITVLEAARAAGIDIPTLCSHESLPAYGACRFCIVEVTRKKRTRMQTACTLPIAESMEIQTHSERVMKIRRILVELMLARCPESDVLHEMAREFGVSHCRFQPVCERNSFGAGHPAGREARSGPQPLPNACAATIVGQSGCILCGMCVRLCDDVMQVGALGFEGRGGRRRVTTPFRKPSEFCITCGACSSICPTGAIELLRVRAQKPLAIPAEFDLGLANRKPIHLPFPQAVPRVPIIDPATCVHFATGGCKVCEDNCQAKAIDHAQPDKIEEVDVGAVILATGFKTFDPKRTPYYGYGVFPNVYTALEVERLVNASGPTAGQIILRDGRIPKSVGIIHCVGSRDDRTNGWCSRVCCMYSLKLAHLLKEHTGAEIFNFYIDMRTPGKSYDEFYRKLLSEGVHFVRGRVGEVTDWAMIADEEGKLVIQVEDTLAGFVRRIPVDMVVLATGLEPQADAQEVRRLFNISCGSEGFFLERHPKLAPVNTFTDGVFLAGACQGPRDIPDTVAQAGAAAAEALVLIDRGYIEQAPNTAHVREEECSGCKSCIPLCPYTAISFDEAKQKAVINEALCKGCGTCVAACPSGSIGQHLFEDDQVFSEINGLLACK